MGNNKFLIVCLFFLSTCTSLCAKEVTDTLESPDNNRVIVTYDISQNNGRVVVKFSDARIKLNRTYREEYKDLDEVTVAFFDRIGTYEDKMEFRGKNAEAFMVPKNVEYVPSKYGYFLLNDNPKLPFELKSSDAIELSIPMFLVHYEKKLRYKVFSQCEDLIVKLSKRKTANYTDGTISQQITQTVTLQEETDGALSEADDANIRIKIIYELLEEQDGVEFSDELREHIQKLRVLGHTTSDKELSSRISEVLDNCRHKEQELKAKASAAAEAAAKDAELKAMHAEKEAQARQDSIEAAAQQKAEEERKQNLWLIVGGVILAILAFVGNQAFQHFRNVKNQQKMMDMQKSAIERAENEAKRRARNMTQSQVSKLGNEARSNTRNIINSSMKRMGKRKGNKGISI